MEEKGGHRLTLDVDEVAEALGVSPVSIYRAVKRGEIPAVRLGGRILIARETLGAVLRGEVPRNLEPRDGV